MGLLDDAIREHLELKRRRGADPAEVEKQEREALGPIGAPPVDDAPPRAEAPPPADDFEDDEPVAYDGRVPLDDERAALRDPEPYDDDPDDLFEDAPAEPPPAPAPPPAGAVRAPHPPPAREPEPPPAVSQPTEQYSVEDLEELRRAEEARAEPPEEGEDVLDETPEFLQEAPEHDRLWFEQRPPRDFDF